MEQFFNLTRVPEAERADRIICHLGGKALEYYSATAERTPEQMPRTWQEFKTFLIETYGSVSVTTVITKLRAIKFSGDFNEVVDKFHEALALGEQPPERQLVWLFLTRFPWELSRGARGKNFNTWVEARHFMEKEYKDWVTYALEYNLEAHEDFKKSMKQDTSAVAQNLFGSSQKDKGAQEYKGPQFRNNKYDNRTRRGSQQGEKKENGTANNGANTNGMTRPLIKCFICSGQGHKGKDCPNNNPVTRKDGQRCRRCNGVGHWAAACPTKYRDRAETPNSEADSKQQKAQAQTGNGQA